MTVSKVRCGTEFCGDEMPVTAVIIVELRHRS